MRLMVWNISRFNTETLTRNDPYNWSYVLETIQTQPLDIFIIVEVQSGAGNRGSTIQGNGALGCLELLNLMRNVGGGRNANWCLVPPLKLVHGIGGEIYTEGIAVYYNGATLDFTGPYYWDGNVGVAGVANVQYPHPWNNVLPLGNNRAGKYDFVRQGYDTALEFPEANCRRPFQTNFTERGGEQRSIKLFSVHLPANSPQASLAMSHMAQIADIRQLGPRDVVIVAGDFNVNAITVGENFNEMQRYYALVAPLTPNQQSIFREATRVMDTEDARPDGYRLAQSLDSILIRYGSALAPLPYNPIAINRVIGTGPYRMGMNLSIPYLGNLYGHGTLTMDEVLELFRSKDNYGHIARWRGVSDHLPLVMDC